MEIKINSLCAHEIGGGGESTTNLNYFDNFGRFYLANYMDRNNLTEIPDNNKIVGLFMEYGLLPVKGDGLWTDFCCNSQHPLTIPLSKVLVYSKNQTDTYMFAKRDGAFELHEVRNFNTVEIAESEAAWVFLALTEKQVEQYKTDIGEKVPIVFITVSDLLNFDDFIRQHNDNIIYKEIKTSAE